MRVAILDCGAVVVRDKEQSWLFGAPSGVKEALDAAGIDVPSVVFTTALRSPGFGGLGPVMRLKEAPLNMNGLTAKPIPHPDGADYAIESEAGRILFSERGSVSVKDIRDYDLAIIKNKHRADKFGDNVITWPWPNADYLLNAGELTRQDEVQLKVWASMDDVPDNLKKVDGAALSLDQANFLARVAEASGEGGKENWAIAHSQFKKSYKKEGDSWVKREKAMDMMSQEAANYEPKGGEGVHCCACCTCYCKDMTCTMVEGEIAPNGVCSLWEHDVTPAAVSTPPPDYTYMEAATDSNGSSTKEYAGDRPIPRIVDIITAALHKAYNDTSDKLFSVGYLSQDERLKIAGSIGEGLDAFRNAIKDEGFAERAVDKWDADQLIQTNKESWTHIYKSERNNAWRWVTITSTASWDRQGELLSTKAMDWAIGFAKLTGFKGPLRYKHIPGLDGGHCDTQLRVGDFLFESGTFDDTPLGLAMRSKLKDNPELWQISPGLAFAKGDLVNGVYKRAAIFERSMTQRPANPFTIILHKEDEAEMKIMTEAELKQAAGELGMEYEEVKMMYERALAAGSGPMGLKEFKEVVEKATGTNASGFPGGANSTHDKKDEDEGAQLKEAIDALDETELKALFGLVGETMKEKGMKMSKADMEAMMDENEDEEMAGEDKPKSKKKADEPAAAESTELDTLKSLVTEQTKLLQEQTKALGELTQALANGTSADKVESAVAKLLNAAPRRQAPTFASQRTKSEEQQLPDDSVVAKRLAAIEQALKEHMPAGKGIYDAFTSTRLNQPKQNRGA